MRGSPRLALLLLLLPIFADSALRADDLDALAEGRRLTSQFYDEELEALHRRFTPDMAADMSLERLIAFRARVQNQAGSEAQVVSERIDVRDSLRAYVRRARFDKAPGLVDVVWVLTPSGKVQGFLLRPAPVAFPSDKLDYVPRVRLRLPVEGEWTVFWGGRTVEENRHAATEDQRFAYDLLVLKDGASHVGDGVRNADYRCFGRPVLAPAGGRVVAAVDGIEDNEPGIMNPDRPLGNHVVLDHGHDEFTFLAHFQEGTVAVEVGDVVEEGEVLGRCGNSGNSSEPHLHVHLQNTPTFGRGQGLPGVFHDYVADGAVVESGEPTKGQVVSRREP